MSIASTPQTPWTPPLWLMIVTAIVIVLALGCSAFAATVIIREEHKMADEIASLQKSVRCLEDCANCGYKANGHWQCLVGRGGTLLLCNTETGAVMYDAGGRWACTEPATVGSAVPK